MITKYKIFEKKDNELNIDIGEMLKSYMYTFLWIEELDDTYDYYDFTEEELEEPRKDVEKFIKILKEFLNKISGNEIIPLINKFGADSLGHDFYLTRNGHGTGFWDREEINIEFTPGKNPYDKAYILRDILTTISTEFGADYIYLRKHDMDEKKNKFNL